MPRRILRIDRPIDHVWDRLQQLETWEGIGGMTDLRDGSHRDDGTLAQFRFSLDTPLGTVNDDAAVTPENRGSVRTMSVRTEVKGFAVTIELILSTVDLSTVDDGEPAATAADFTIDAESTSLITRPLASALDHTLESGIDRESDRMVQRLEA